MKKLVLWFFLLTLTVYAGAQQTINFADLPDVATATPLPTGYHSLTWSGVSYVDPFKATGMGPGFQHSGSIAGTDVAFGPRVCGGWAAIARSPRPAVVTFNWSMRLSPPVTPAER